MTDHIIKVENLYKLYRLGLKQKEDDSLVATCLAWLKSPWKNFEDLKKLSHFSLDSTDEDILFALKDISFNVKQGEVLGIIGRNGAGKSTLLKVLSRVTAPTSGRISITGRMASLLEVGTGFHPEMTGRENVYMNGTILGMSKNEIDLKFDEIVDFSGVEKFLDTPLKRYSSGMKVRLAFSVAAHLEPEILIIDEVLAVGDSEFQKKCLGKMENVAGQGRTVIFVSHNMAAVQTLCTRAILLKHGVLCSDSEVNTVIADYLKTIETSSGENCLARLDRKGKGDVRLSAIKIVGKSDNKISSLVTGGRAQITFSLTNILPELTYTFTFYDSYGRAIATFNSSQRGENDTIDTKLDKQVIVNFKEFMLLPGRYSVNVAIFSKGVLQDHLESAANFDVEPGFVNGHSIGPSDYGVVFFHHHWSLPK